LIKQLYKWGALFNIAQFFYYLAVPNIKTMLRSILIFGFMVMFLVIAQYTRAQTVDEIIDNYVKTIGGKEKLLAIKTIYMEGARQMMGNEVAVKLTKEQGKLSRTEFEMGAGNGFFLITEKEGWSMFSMRSASPSPMLPAAVAAMQTELDIAGPLVDYAAKGHKVELVGKESPDGIECFKIKLTTGAGKDIFYWIDTKTNLLHQSSQKGGMGGGRGGAGADAEIITVYSDYHEVDGILFAHTQETKGQGPATGGTTFDKIELNKPVDPKLYKPE
jgi:hypothetical protein